MLRSRRRAPPARPLPGRGRPAPRRTLWRGGLLAGLGAVLALLVALAPARAEDLPGMPWPSGVSGLGKRIDEFAEWRGRRVDILTIWHPWWKQGWEGSARFARMGTLKELGDWDGQLSMGYALFPRKGDHEECAAGEYDAYHEDIARQIAEMGRGDMILRVGWEANGSYPWNANNDPDPEFANYKACFRRVVGILKAENPEIKIDWTSRKRGSELFRGRHKGKSLEVMYPGDDVVDIIGVDYYDSYPSFPDQKSWDRFYMRGGAEDPVGVGAWLAFAKARGKKLSFPEWAVRQDGDNWDNPFFVEQMHAFFVNNADDIAYETYFNVNAKGDADGEGGGSTIFPVADTPESSEVYRELWRGGAE